MRRLEAEAGGGEMSVGGALPCANLYLVAAEVERGLFPRDGIIPPPGIGDPRRRMLCTSGWPGDVHSALRAAGRPHGGVAREVGDVPEIAEDGAILRGIKATHVGADGVPVELQAPRL